MNNFFFSNRGKKNSVSCSWRLATGSPGNIISTRSFMDAGAATAAVPKSDSLQLPRDAFCRRGRYPGWGEAALHAGAQVCVAVSA
jgi:hypothetical protein